jgi:hypothetical protein
MPESASTALRSGPGRLSRRIYCISYLAARPGSQSQSYVIILLSGLPSLTSKADLNLYVSRLTPAQKSEKCIAHALAVQRAVFAGNYRAFFRLYHYTVAPKMNPYIMDFFRDRERIKALIVMSRSQVYMFPLQSRF